MRTEKGFTLLELLMTVTVLGVLTALAVPSFREMMDRNAVISQANELVSSILLARSEAIKRSQPVVVRRIGFWTDRLNVFADANGNDTYQSGADGPRIVDHRVSGNTVTITGNGAVATFIRFNSRGRAATAPDGNPLTPNADFFTLTRNGATRFICFNPTGRPRVQEAACL